MFKRRRLASFLLSESASWRIFCLFFQIDEFSFCRSSARSISYLYEDMCGNKPRWNSLDIQLESLILAQSERWRRGLGMQVERSARKGEIVAKGCVTREQSTFEWGITLGNRG